MYPKLWLDTVTTVFIVVGGILALLQLRQTHKQRSRESALQMLHSFQTPEFLTAVNIVLVLSGVYRLSRRERAVLKTLVVSTVTAILIAMAAVELLAAFGIVRPAPGVFFLGLVVLLGISTVLVARFLFARPAD